jgi:hypothetical protein
MPGRSTPMTQLRGTPCAARLRRAPRVLCLSAALLCALGVLGTLSGSLAHPTHGTSHRAVAAVALVGMQDGHGTQLRTDHSAVAATTAVLATRRSIVVAAAERAETTTVDVDSARTRGPPGSA